MTTDTDATDNNELRGDPAGRVYYVLRSRMHDREYYTAISHAAIRAGRLLSIVDRYPDAAPDPEPEPTPVDAAAHRKRDGGVTVPPYVRIADGPHGASIWWLDRAAARDTALYRRASDLAVQAGATLQISYTHDRVVHGHDYWAARRQGGAS